MTAAGVDEVLNFEWYTEPPFASPALLLQVQWIIHVALWVCRLGENVVLSPTEGCLSTSVLAVGLTELVCSRLEHWVDLRWLVDFI